MKVLVYLPEEKLAPKGGPFAVGYYYYEEMKRRGDNILEFTHVDAHYEDVHKKGRFVTSKFPKWFNNAHRTIRHIINRRKYLSGRQFAPKQDFSKYDIIHFHQSNHMYLERENLKNFKGIVLYQSHSPLPYGQEQCTDIPSIYDFCIPKMREKYEEIDRYCLERADYIIFPCEEAEESYYNNWYYFTQYKKKHPENFRYVLTGIPACKAEKTRTEVLKEYGVPENGFVISYVGRHNTVKGYDLLKEIASDFFNREEEAWVISAGLESPFKRLEHMRWKEIGFTNDPHSLISASDVFVLPNRVTYFDIVMLEILALGKIVVASKTGGNRYFDKMGVEGVLLYKKKKKAIKQLSRVKNMTIEERNVLGAKNKDFFDKYLSSRVMYDNYIELIRSFQDRNKHSI